MSHKLLLADDSHTIQRVVELTFANEDIDVVTVDDGAQAIAAIERDEPDIVLADVSMPGKNGYDVASFVRSDSARTGIPVVLLTGAFEPLDEERCDAIGRHEVLVKPFEPREVVGKVRELLDLPVARARAAPRDAGPTATAAAGRGASHETVPESGESSAVPSKESAEADAGAAGAVAVNEAADQVVGDEAAVDEADPPATVAVEAVAAEQAVAPEAELQAAEEQAAEDRVGSREAPSADAQTEPSPPDATAAVDASVEEKAAEQSPAGVADPPPIPAAVDAASPSEHVDPSSAVADTDSADPADPAGSPSEQAVEDRAAAPSAGEAVPEGARRTPPAGAGGSVLAQSFVIFLAVEQGASLPELPAADTAGDSRGAEPPLPRAVMDDLVDRVVERLADTVLRNTVAEVVSRIAERLAREEITRVPPGAE